MAGVRVRRTPEKVVEGMSYGNYTTAPGILFEVKAASQTEIYADGRRENGVLVFGISAEASGDWGALDGARIAKAAEKAALRELEKQTEKRDAEFAAQARIASKAFGMMEKAE